MGFVGDKVALQQILSDYVGFLHEFSFHRPLHTHNLSSGTGKIGQILAHVPSGLSLTPSQETKKIKVKGNVISVTGEAHRAVRRRRSIMFETICPHMSVMSALRVGRPPFTPRKISGTHFCWRLNRPQGHSASGRIRSTE
jgi:hypothetical protein